MTNDLQDLKLKFYSLIIALALEEDAFLDACKAYQEVYDTDEVKNDETKAKEVSTPTVFWAATPFSTSFFLGVGDDRLLCHPRGVRQRAVRHAPQDLQRQKDGKSGASAVRVFAFHWSLVQRLTFGCLLMKPVSCSRVSPRGNSCDGLGSRHCTARR